WDVDRVEDQQIDDIEKWFKNALKLPRGFHIADIHTQKNYQQHLRGANVTLMGGRDISIGPSRTACVWIKTKKKVEDFSEGQTIGELFLIDKLHPTRAMTVLTDCNNHWNIYFFLMTKDEKQCIVTCNIGDRGVALVIIKEFVFEEGMFLNELIGKDVTYEVKLPEPLKKKAKFLERIFEADNENRMADIVGDMSEQELFNMTVRKRLMLVRDFCRLDE
ncbi:8043_t:CDS:1, partial [Funneliformis mosseae]